MTVQSKLGALFVCVAAGAVLVSGFATSKSQSLAAGGNSNSGVGFIRVNQVGYETMAAKTAVLMSRKAPKDRTFEVLMASSGAAVFSGVATTARGWNGKFPYALSLDFSGLRRDGRFVVEADGFQSPQFSVGPAADLYHAALVGALHYYLAQQDGSSVPDAILRRKPSHLANSRALVYERPLYRNGVLVGRLQPTGAVVDAEGGWFDAGDYLKFVETASYTTGLLLFAVREHPTMLHQDVDFWDEARYELDWLNHMWDPKLDRVYYQVGIGDGNNKIVADHDVWRLPQMDDRFHVKRGSPEYFVKYRPVFFDGGPDTLISRNLAGRLAADWALCFQVYREADPAFAATCLKNAELVYSRAKTDYVGRLVTTSPYGYYPETEWRDDMEWGAAELALALQAGAPPGGLPHSDPQFYLSEVEHWAEAYIHSPGDGRDTLNLYDDSGIAHYEVLQALREDSTGDAATVRAVVLADLARQLSNAQSIAHHDAFGFGLAYNSQEDLTPHALGLALEAKLYDAATSSQRFAAFGERELD